MAQDVQSPQSIDSRWTKLTWDDLEFYLGTIWINQRAVLTPVYEMIFRRFKAHGLDWLYHWNAAPPDAPRADTLAPDIVLAYQDVYGRLPRRWMATAKTQQE